MSLKDLDEKLGVRRFPPAPARFDPLGASNRDLRKYGFPSRPDARSMPAANDLWRRLHSMGIRQVPPGFTPLPQRVHGPLTGPLAAPGTAKVRSGTPVPPLMSNNWSGMICNGPANKPVIPGTMWVAGYWTVPHVTGPSQEKFYASQWVGLDGYVSTDGYESLDVLQAGTATDLIYGVQSTTFWWEWYPAVAVAVSSLPVVPGDLAAAIVCADGPSSATFFLYNLTRLQCVSFSQTAPAGTTLMGNCAEWILEAPKVNGVQATLPNYGMVYFDGCLGNLAGTPVFGGKGIYCNMLDANNALVSIPIVATETLFKVDYRS